MIKVLGGGRTRVAYRVSGLRLQGFRDFGVRVSKASTASASCRLMKEFRIVKKHLWLQQLVLSIHRSGRLGCKKGCGTAVLKRS